MSHLFQIYYIKIIVSVKYNGNQWTLSSHKGKGGLVMEEESVPAEGTAWYKYPETKEE